MLIESLYQLCRVRIDGHHVVAFLSFTEELLIALLVRFVQKFFQEIIGICLVLVLRGRNLYAVLGIYRDLVVSPLHLIHLAVVHHGEKSRIAQLLTGSGNKKLPYHRINKKGDNGCYDQDQKSLPRVFESAVVAAAIVIVVHSILLALEKVINVILYGWNGHKSRMENDAADYISTFSTITLQRFL